MRRKIKFRAWDKIRKCWVVDYRHVLPTHYEGSKYPIKHGGVDHIGVYVPEGKHHDPVKNAFENEYGDCDLMLYTGLKDKNGKEIYEGDILLGAVLSDTSKSYVVWDSGNLCWSLLECGSDVRDGHLAGKYNLEVIGNIYDNPELIGDWMKREIKFRAWNSKKKKMETDNMAIDWCGHLIRHHDNGIDDYSLMQYTGIKDKNRNEIYDGDILKIEWGKQTLSNSQPYRVRWNTDSATWEVAQKHSWASLHCALDMEIIGNIFENPELLEVSE